ncbi:MAG: hypothetical protein Q4D71_09955 [Oscillospiraceae bacterium]|nr:hypothetical protein [Oscillospiraceae bacterium]
MIRQMTREEVKRFHKERCEFLDYKDIQEYIEDIVVCLVYSSWHYSEERARARCEERMFLIEECFEKKVPADDCYVDVGYSCG